MKQTQFKKIEQKTLDNDFQPQEFTKRDFPPKKQELTDKYGFIQKSRTEDNHDKKTINARIEKWRLMIKDFEKQSSEKVKERVRKGVPNGIRIIVWPLLARVNDMKADACVKLNCGNYQEFMNKSQYAFEHQIRLDVLRTFPNNVNFQDKTACSESLVMVLKALSAALPNLGYCQGMNFLTAGLIMVTDDENAFWILYSLMTHYKQAPKYQDPSKLYREFFILDYLIQKYFSDLYLILKRNQIDLFYFCTEWMITLFSSILPMDIFYRVFEIFLVEGEKTLFRCALSILYFKKQKLIELDDFEQQLQFLKSVEDLKDIQADVFILVMLTKFPFSKSVISNLDKQYIQQQQQQQQKQKQKK